MTFAVLLLTALLSMPVFAAQVQEDPLDRQVLDIAGDLRCAVCQNQPISESNAPLAQDMRQIIREQLQAGKSRDEIMQYFVDRYGNYVLMKPPVHGTGTLLWIFPLLIGIVLAVSAFFYLKHRRRDTLPPAPELSKKDLELVRAARERSK
jgi:cytochrome c-type biogenesis protein CcmH